VINAALFLGDLASSVAPDGTSRGPTPRRSPCSGRRDARRLSAAGVAVVL